MVDADAESAALSNAKYAGHEFLSGQRTVECFLRVLAIVAVAAVRLGPGFGEVAEQDAAPAFGGFRVVDHLT